MRTNRFRGTRPRFCSTETHITTVDGEHAAEVAVKKSRFVARARGSCISFDDAKKFIGRVSDQKARHNCWAWVGQQSQRSSDDGEPSGTAGRPILNSIEYAGLTDVVVVVTRYKSKDAPKLGAGGLLRAYGSASSNVLTSAKHVTVIPSSELEIRFPIGELGKVQSFIARYEGHKPGSGSLIRGKEEYEGTTVSIAIMIETDFVDSFRTELLDVSNGSAAITK